MNINIVKMKHVFFIFFLLLFATSCSTKMEKNSHRVMIQKFPMEKLVTLDSVNVEPVLFCIGDMLIIGDFLVTVDIKNDVFFQIFSLPELNYVGDFIHKGVGPAEEVAVFPFLQRTGLNAFTYRSIDKQKIVSFDALVKKLSLTGEYQIPDEYMNILNSFLMGNKLLGYNMMGESAKEYISCDLSTKEITDFGSDYPKVDFSIDTKNRNMLFSKIMASNANNDRFVALFDKFPLMRIYDANGNVISENEYVNNQSIPSAYSKADMQGVDLSSLTVNYLKLKVTNKFIYGLYSGKTQGELGVLNTADLCYEIHIWDWEGNPVKRLIFKTPVSNFAVSLDDSYILLYSFEKEDVLYKIDMAF